MATENGNFPEIHHDDPNVKIILNDPDIVHAYRRNMACQKNIVRAAEDLKDEKDAIEVMKIALPAILKQQVKIFFSYKREQFAEAQKIISELKNLAKWGFEIVWDQEIQPGDNWENFIRDGIRTSHWFILLLPDDMTNLDWCLFETGMFRSGMRSSRIHRLFCLHSIHANVPGVFSVFQSISANAQDPSNVERFLHTILSNEYFFPGIPKIREVSDEEVKAAAEKINAAILPSGIQKPKLPNDIEAAFPSGGEQDVDVTNQVPRQLKVFLCHSSGDKSRVRPLCQFLHDQGVAAWLDEEEILPGQRWEVEIPKAIRSSDVVLVCVSTSSLTKEGYVQKEIKQALDVAEEKPDDTIFLIPARLDDCEMPDRLSGWHWVNLFEKQGRILLMKSLGARASQLSVELRAQDP